MTRAIVCLIRSVQMKLFTDEEKKLGLKHIIIVRLQYSNYNYLYNVEIIFNTQLTLDLVHENLASTDYHERDFQDLSMIGS